jgi:short-subunit dehydrogenase
MNTQINFDGKVAWITGASSGIGEALVKEFIVRGATVIGSSRSESGYEKLKSVLKENSSRLIWAPFDLGDTSNIGDVVDTIIQKTGRIDYLINIGGVSQRAKAEETPIWLDRKIFEINYFGTIALTKAVLPYMINQHSGHILATSSITGRFGFPLRSAYSASKQALHGFFETLYLENKENNIKVSVIIPGRVNTAISFHALDQEGKEHGMLDDGQANGISAGKAASIIIKGIKKDKREILVGGKEMLMLYIRKYLPWLFFRIAGKIKST